MVSNPRLSLFHKSEIKKKKEERENVRYIVIYTNEEDAWNEEQVACKQYFFPSIFFFSREKRLKEKSVCTIHLTAIFLEIISLLLNKNYY